MFVPLCPVEFRDRAETLFAKKIGVIDGEKQFTYAQFGDRTHRLANALRKLGLEKGDRVSFITYNTHQLLEAYFGVIEAGGILNPINVRLTPQDIGYISLSSTSHVKMRNQSEQGVDLQHLGKVAVDELDLLMRTNQYGIPPRRTTILVDPVFMDYETIRPA